jgi:hypothetical protein
MPRTRLLLSLNLENEFGAMDKNFGTTREHPPHPPHRFAELISAQRRSRPGWNFSTDPAPQGRGCLNFRRINI